jgi:hypothetical protein
LATLGVILSACYALWLYRKVGSEGSKAEPTITDMGWREIAIFTPLIVLTLLLGFYPKPVLDMSAASVTALLDNYQHAWRGEIRSAGEVRPCRERHSARIDDPGAARNRANVGAMALLMLGAYRGGAKRLSASARSCC